MTRDFLMENRRFLAFGLLVAFFSSFGQTYFIGVFRGPIMAEFALDNSDFGLLYLLVTLGSAVGLAFLGHFIDILPLRRYVAILGAAITLVCLSFLASYHFVLLLACLLLIRLLGQGLMVHTAMTSMSRYFDKNRGSAIAIAGLGMPLGQAVFPVLAVALMAVFAWREVWALLGIGFLVIGGPCLFLSMRGHERRHQAWLSRQAEHTAGKDAAIDTPSRSYRRRDVIRDYRFYLMLPALIASPFWITAVFFFAEEIAASKGWSLQTYTGLYWVNAAGAVSLPLLAGILVDRVGGMKLLPSYPPLLSLALMVGVYAETGAAIAIFMFLLGAVNGLALPINNAMWAEMYGTRYLGQIKALSTSLMVISTALAPYLLGQGLDLGISIAQLLTWGALYSVISTLLLLPILPKSQ